MHFATDPFRAGTREYTKFLTRSGWAKDHPKKIYVDKTMAWNDRRMLAKTCDIQITSRRNGWHQIVLFFFQYELRSANATRRGK